MKEHFEEYLQKLRNAYQYGGTEHTGRPELKAFLEVVCAAHAPDAHIQHEPKLTPGKGAPDFKITRQGLVLGYVENKPIDKNLDKVLKSNQIKRYRSLSDNILLTDYLQWIWITPDNIQRARLCHSSDLENPKHVPSDKLVAAVAELLQGFFSEAPEGIDKAADLAVALAVRSRLLRDFLTEELARQEKEGQGERLLGLYGAFRDQISHELPIKDFAGAFAQTLAYGLFIAKLTAGTNRVDLHNVKSFIPGSFRLIRELTDFLDSLEDEPYRDVRWVVEEILSIVNGLELNAIREDLSFRHRKVRRGVKARSEEEARLFERDAFVYFYEDYLRRYDPQEREQRGVYYTPPPIVNFIVRSIDTILKETFGINAGLADHDRVTVLDFACGTGTFLLEVFERIFENIGGADSSKADLIVREHMLKNIFGFEYLIAPYTIAHLKLSQYLADRGHSLGDAQRLLVYLTNTLEPIEPQKNWLLPELTRETEAAHEVKQKPILVITGNPPYSGHSKNMGPHAKASIEPYKLVDGMPLGEKNPKWLQDDYVKFIRFAQMKMDKVDEGVVGIITNHSYLTNPTFRGMRQSLMRTFDQIYIWDLHGSTKPKETPPNGQHNENVFDIEKGVAISLFVKKSGASGGVWHDDLWGRRLEKYKAAAETKLNCLNWVKLVPVSPFYLFVRQDRNRWTKYEQGWSVPDILPVKVLGFQTHRDHFAIAFTQDDIEARVRDLEDESLSDQALQEKYKLRDNSDWQLSKARKSLAECGKKATKIIDCAYRPFDKRSCYFGHEFMDRPRRELLDHVAWRKNVQLLVSRQIGTSDWRHVFVAEEPANDCLVSNQSREANYAFPLYLYPPSGAGKQHMANLFEVDDPFDGKERIENFSPAFRQWLNERYSHHFSPEDVMGYIYAVLHAPTFRENYSEFLHIDFPRIPFTDDRKGFEVFSALGWDLIQKHLLRDVPNGALAKFHGKGDCEVEKPHYVPAEEAVYINVTQHFAPVPEEVWHFHIGGYQVIDKYLKSRKNRTLSLGEIENVEFVTNVLAFTIEQMQRIDEAYVAAFGR